MKVGGNVCVPNTHFYSMSLSHLLAALNSSFSRPQPSLTLHHRLAQGLALVGATVTGVLARKRREEMEALNSKLRTINAQLRRQREEEVGPWCCAHLPSCC